jgi:hypothetical protein
MGVARGRVKKVVGRPRPEMLVVVVVLVVVVLVVVWA